MRRGTAVRIFSLKRMILSIVLGFMLPVSYLLTLFLIFYFTGKRQSEILVIPVAWPRVLWDALVDQPRSDANLASGLLFIAVCDTAVYGALSYIILLTTSVLTPKPVVLESPPTPAQCDPG